MKILLVDDSRTIRSLQRQALERIGYTEIVEAVDGREGLEKAQAEPPDLILVDLNMPNLDGIGFVKAFRVLDQKTPIIMVTTESEKSRVLEAVRAGVNSYIVKPFTPQVLQQKIDQTLAKAA